MDYDTGEQVFVKLHGIGSNIDVRLDQSEITIPATYTGMANFKNVIISNRGTEVIRFHFSEFATLEEEKIQKQSRLKIIEDEEAEDQRKYKLKEGGDALHDTLSILTRSYQNRRINVNADLLLFNNPSLEISPVQG